MAVGSIGWIVRDRATRQALLGQQIRQALHEIKSEYQTGKLSEAMSSTKRAEGLLANGEGNSDLHQQVSQWRADLETVNRLEQIRLDQASLPKKSKELRPTQQRSDSPGIGR